MRGIYYALQNPAEDSIMANHAGKPDHGNPKFGRLLLVLLAAVLFCGLLTWVMGAFFPTFPNF